MRLWNRMKNPSIGDIEIGEAGANLVINSADDNLLLWNNDGQGLLLLN